MTTQERSGIPDWQVYGYFLHVRQGIAFFTAPKTEIRVAEKPIIGRFMVIFWRFYALQDRLGFFCPFPQCWRGFRAWPRERHPCEVGVFAPTDASLFSVFSGGHASVLEAISFAGAGLEAVGCGWQLL